MITRKKAADGNTYLIQNFIEALKRGKKVRQMFDQEIMAGRKSIKVLDDIAKLAAQCLILEDKLRPEMVEVADRLRKCRKDLQLPRREAMVESSGGNYPTNPTEIEQPRQVLAISLAELKEITRNFRCSTLIGQGSHAEVFLGELKDSRKCVVKILKYSDVDNEFLLKVQSISRLEHNNVVQLLSYCIEESVHALVYEYSSSGSLPDILHGKKGAVGGGPGKALSWAQRVNIALSSAEGIEFIYEKAEHCITHRSSNQATYFSSTTMLQRLLLILEPSNRTLVTRLTRILYIMPFLLLGLALTVMVHLSI
ncbi:hypothetical protein PVAP13_5NG219300 [Panicum virgatum]|uniref:Protein kinase domain-containing protein n=1 Tax=Panicum virgatum TaxID=38727 RepID=A0A8T0RVE3_PANVG|nr:hypothetical protein PVAP13_5NG219300 [Panicum virgatum]